MSVMRFKLMLAVSKTPTKAYTQQSCCNLTTRLLTDRKNHKSQAKFLIYKKKIKEKENFSVKVYTG